MITIIDLPLDILESIINQVNISCSNSQYQTSLVSLTQTCRFFHQIITPVLYNKIVIYDNENASLLANSNSIKTFIHINQLGRFINSLTIQNFQFISSIHINCHSNFASFDYFQLYSKLNAFWNITNHPIEFINFDVDNIRRCQCLNHYITVNNSTNIVEENDEWWNPAGLIQDSHHHKLNNLANWTILSRSELFNIPMNPNLTTLDIFIEGKDSSFSSNIPNNLIHNFAFITNLHLNTTTSTKIFANLPDSVNCKNLQNLSLCYSHTFNQPKLSLGLLANKINFNNLNQLELKLNCFHQDCSCISQFYQDLIQYSDEFTQLTKLSIINYKSKNSSNNLNQYNYLISHQLSNLFKKFSNINTLYFNINEFLKLDQLKIDWTKFASSISKLPHLKSLVIVDFFNWWMPSFVLPDRSILTAENLLNSCQCEQCNHFRYKFTKMAEYDSENNYTHNFTNFKYKQSNIGQVKVHLNNKPNLKFLTFIYQQFKGQFNQSLIYSLHGNNFRQDKDLWNDYQELFKHNCLNELNYQIKQDNFDLKVNLGGVIV
ncbi:hypothetical protein JA1_005177 [Spathaspora sp. JA1]|nr:hypothetical protein JA1_005177 [Spathaspora sp. JA1]